MKERGFTLVELLAVIIIIGLLSIIIIPKVKDTISDSRKNGDEISANSLVRSATNYYLEQRSSGVYVDCFYNFTDNVNTCSGFDFSGNKPSVGRLEIKKNGTVGLFVKFGNFCYIKDFDSSSVGIFDYSDDLCG